MLSAICHVQINGWKATFLKHHADQKKFVNNLITLSAVMKTCLLHLCAHVLSMLNAF